MEKSLFERKMEKLLNSHLQAAANDFESAFGRHRLKCLNLLDTTEKMECLKTFGEIWQKKYSLFLGRAMGTQKEYYECLERVEKLEEVTDECDRRMMLQFHQLNKDLKT